jgi:methyl-accepting chemotaxis protein
MKKIKTKMLLLMLPIVLLALSSISIFSYYFAKNIIIINANKILEETSQAYANKIDGWLQMQLEMIDSVRASVEKTSMTPVDELSYLNYMVEKYDNVTDLYIL